jgi:hypothetical protein
MQIWVLIISKKNVVGVSYMIFFPQHSFVAHFILTTGNLKKSRLILSSFVELIFVFVFETG